jgi:beta-phosphoglucomutase-like phosphatase (HAD superfamily)
MRFDVLVCAQDVAATKPDPEPYLLAAKLLGVLPEDCFALEDSPNGVASAEAAGCRVLAVPSLLPISPAPGRTVVRSLLDLTADTSGVYPRAIPSRGSLGGSSPRGNTGG